MKDAARLQANTALIANCTQRAVIRSTFSIALPFPIDDPDAGSNLLRTGIGYLIRLIVLVSGLID